VQGTLNIGSQYHVHLENHDTIVTPVESQYVIECCSQGPVGVQSCVSNVLGVNNATVQVKTRRCGGGFGAKSTAVNFTSALAAAATPALLVPVSIELTLQDPMRGLGARPLYQYEFKVGLDSTNKIIAWEGTVYLACGYNFTDAIAESAVSLANLITATISQT